MPAEPPSIDGSAAPSPSWRRNYTVLRLGVDLGIDNVIAGGMGLSEATSNASVSQRVMRVMRVFVSSTFRDMIADCDLMRSLPLRR